MNDLTTKAWRLYEAGTEYNRKIGLYETVRRNEQFYRGEQWQGNPPESLPRPVFNITRRIVDYLIGTLSPEKLSIRYSDDRLPYLNASAVRENVSEGLRLLGGNAMYRWKRNHMNELTHRALLEAAISGDGVFYCWWDSDCDCGQPFCGDIHTDLVDAVNLFVADPTRADIQSQDYVMLAGRCSAETLRQEARAAGAGEDEIARIHPDEAENFPNEPTGSDKATYLIRFYREDGEVLFEKTTRSCLIRRSATGMKHYPVAYFNWLPRRGSFHGTSPITELIPNQRYVNAAYALAMKHMTDAAFSKVIYDQTRIPEWNNEVGEAIAAIGGGNISDAVSVIEPGKMHDEYLHLIESVVENTKSVMGATESALGDERATNTSAILALQEASQISLKQVNARLCRCIGELASIWADMLCANCPPERLLPVSENGGVTARQVDYPLLGRELLHATAETGSTTYFTAAATVTLLDRLLDAGHITVSQYLQHLPEGCVPDRAALLQELTLKGGEVNDR